MVDAGSKRALEDAAQPIEALTSGGSAVVCCGCGNTDVKYRCPRCERITCSLQCCVAHKNEFDCNGKRDRTKFVGIKSFTDADLSSDFFFLEEVSRSTNRAARSRSELNANAKRYNSNKKRKVAATKANTSGALINPDIPADWLARFPIAVQLFAEHTAKRGVALTLLAPGMSKRSRNTSYMDVKKKTLYWRVEWAFPSAEVAVSHFEERAKDDTTLFELLGKYLNPSQDNVATRGKLKKYAIPEWKEHILLLLRKEFTPASQPQYYRLDGNLSLESNLKRKAVVEFPVITIALVADAEKYPVAYDAIETVASTEASIELAQNEQVSAAEPEAMEVWPSADVTTPEQSATEDEAMSTVTEKLFLIQEEDIVKSQAPTQLRNCTGDAWTVAAIHSKETMSWFADSELKPTGYSVSYVCNNLSKHGEMMVYASVDDAVYVDATHTPYLTHKLPSAEKSAVHQVRFCTLKGLAIIVVASDSGIQIYDGTGEECLSEIALKDTVGADVEGDNLYCQGICSVHMKQPRLVVGTSLGKMLVIEKNEEAKSGEGSSSFDVCKVLSEHEAAICCVESSFDGTLMASSDTSGDILIRNPGEGFEVLHRIAIDEYHATCMTFMAENWLVVGFVTGCLRLFSPDDFHLHAEVAAHTRAITALDAHNEFVASVSEDTFLNIWEISSSKPGSGPRVKLASSQAVPNDLLTGVAFMSTNTLFTATYDTAHLKFWSPE
ncbi:WD repeat-containing protein 54 [Phytophthora boehmeriae]|uniref:WD repeat-containing protein 54 n=1 Tax=Phytophthora boehmeriae TaxID=109152 RepID=A0A8T1W8G5_9STRA|nr:WD repeat-containing protein 54 [Phytophthora boehmeriae]